MVDSASAMEAEVAGVLGAISGIWGLGMGQTGSVYSCG